jgi:predicted ABC-type ATPase
MAEGQPNLILLAGPNGAGKSTAAPSLLAGELAIPEYVNADVIARGLSAFRPESAAFEAGKIALRRLWTLAERRVDFAFETTLAGVGFVPWIAELRRQGYKFHLFFLWLPSPEVALLRVLQRVQTGGHNIPPETVQRRYRSGLRNFFRHYQPLADRWRFYDNSGGIGPRLLAAGDADGVRVLDEETWGGILLAVQDG